MSSKLLKDRLKQLSPEQLKLLNAQLKKKSLEKLSEVQQTNYVVKLKDGSAPPIFFVHGGPGLASAFIRLTLHLPPERPLYGIQAKCADKGDDFHVSVSEMAESYRNELMNTIPTGPFIIGGYSGGGMVAYELSQQLVRAGRKVELLIMLDGGPLKHDVITTDEELVKTQPRYFAYLIAQLASERNINLPYTQDQLGEQLEIGPDVLSNANQIISTYFKEPRPDVSNLAHSRRMMMHMGRISNQYSPSPYDGRVLEIYSTENPEWEQSWKDTQLLRGRTELKRVRCDHYHLVREPFVAEVANAITSSLVGSDIE